MRVRLLLVALGLVSSAACAPASTAATPDSAFAKTEMCPIDRVTVKELPTPTLTEIVFREATPPVDVKDDPERLTIWISNHKRSWSLQRNLHDYKVEGCGIDAEIVCGEAPRDVRCTTVATATSKTIAETKALP